MSGDEDEEKVLYDLTVPCEWPPVTTAMPVGDGVSLWKTLAAITKGIVQLSVDKLTRPFRNGGRTVPPALNLLLETSLPWKIALNDDGTLLAVLKDEQLEIRSIVDEFESVLTCCEVTSDPWPALRKLLWSGSLIAVALSTGGVLVFMSGGRLLSQLIDKVAPSDVGSTSPLTAMTFVPCDPNITGQESRLALLCVLYYGQSLETYEIQSDGEIAYCHCFSFSDYFPAGVNSMLYHERLSTLIVGAAPSNDDDAVIVSGWRPIDAAPHWAPRLGQEGPLKKKPKGFISRMFSRTNSQAGNGVVWCMSTSPNGEHLATVELSGRLSIWDLPSFKLNKSWELSQQTGQSEGTSSPSKNKVLVLPVEVNWWSDEALIVVDSAGDVRVPSLTSLTNLLGDHPEPGLAITPAIDGRFYILDCECSRTIIGGRRFRVPSLSEDSDDESANTTQTQVSFAQASSRLLKQILFFLTESNRFRPPKAKPKAIKRQYTLACLKSMPPEECYERKMQGEEYGEALLLAQQYGLDCDLVYLRQWRSYPVSIATIQDYLSKISKRSEVLQECMNRVPEDYESARQLLEYGLSRTSYRELCLAGEGLVGMEGDLDELSTADVEKELSTWERLTSEQTSICQYRHLLLSYLDRLSTYQVILGGPGAAEEMFTSREFDEFRSSNLVQSAVSYARDGNWRAVEALFRLHPQITQPHRLAILSNLPETLSPLDYQHLLPVLSDGCVEGGAVDAPRDPDWVEGVATSHLCTLPNELNTNSGDFLYDETPEWAQYMNPSSDVLSSWYQERAREIEEYSGQVDSALHLVEAGMENGVVGLGELRHHLQTLYSLVYQCGADSRLGLSRLQAMSQLEILQLILTDTSGDGFVKTFIESAAPFLSRLSSTHPSQGERLMSEYLTLLAKDDLEPVLKLFHHAKDKSNDLLLRTGQQQLSLALACIYSCKRADQLSVADEIVNCLPPSSPSASEDLASLHTQVDLLRQHISALDVLQMYGVRKPVHYIRDIQANADEVEQLMVKLTRVASRSEPMLNEAKWRSLLQHMLTLRSGVFPCLSTASCYKVFVSSLLCSGQLPSIHLAKQLLTLSSKPSKSSFNYRLSHDVSCDLVLVAARDYFNSATSLMDSEMDLARECLGLLPSPTREIQSELNLIASLSLLDDFGLSMLPIEVRLQLTDNKLDIVRSVLDSSPAAYRDHEKIARLAGLLDDRESESLVTPHSMSETVGHALILVILTAIQNNDLRLSERLCSRLMAAKFPPAWEVCRKMAADPNNLGSVIKLKMIDFCLTYCPAEEIKHTITLRQKLQAKNLYESCVGRTHGSTSGWGNSPSIADSAKSGVQELMGKGVQGIVKSAGAVQQFIRKGQYEQSAKVPNQQSGDSVQAMISELTKMADTVPKSTEQSVQITSHSVYSLVPGGGHDGVELELAVNQALLYTIQLANEMAGRDEEKLECTRVLLDLARQCSSQDTHLMIGYLLSLHKTQPAEEFFSSLPKSKCVMELVVYYICLQIYAQYTSGADPKLEPHPYTHTPADIVDHVITSVKSCDTANWPASTQPLLKLLNEYLEKIEDFKETSILLGLGLGIDTEQFELDHEYQHNIILSLARALDEKVFTISCKLAARHQVPEWELYIELLDSLLTSNSLKPAEVQRRLKESRAMEVLLCNPQQTCDRLCGETYERVSGVNLSSLLLYYTTLQQCQERGAHLKQESVAIATHVRLLKKLKSNVTGLDYKLLMSGEIEPIRLLSPVLTANNVQLIAKLADKIPNMGCGFLSADIVYRSYAERIFWDGNKKDQSTDSESHILWVHRFEGCQEFIMKLGASEMKGFAKDILFSKQSLKLGFDSRLELVKRVQRVCVQRLKQEPPDSGFQELKSELEIFSKHLKMLTSSKMKSIVEEYSIEQVKWDQCLVELDTSISDPEKVHSICVKMIEESLPVDLIHTVLTATHGVCPNNLTAAALLREVLNDCIEQLKQDTSSESSSDHPEQAGYVVATLEKAMAAVSGHESSGGSLVTSGQVLEVVQPYCSDSSYNATHRRSVLRLIEKYLYLCEEDVGLLLLYQTQSLLAAGFTTEVKIEYLSTSEARQKFFTSLLREATNKDMIQKLFSLLQAWDSSCSSESKSWSELLLASAAMPAAVHCVPTMRAGLKGVSHETDNSILDMVCQHSQDEGLRLALVTRNLAVMESILKATSHDTLCIDGSLLELILASKSVLLIMKLSPLIYSELCSHLSKPVSTEALNTALLARLYQCPESELGVAMGGASERVKSVAGLLYEGGYVIEAGSLLISLQEFHPTLATVNTAVSFVRKLFN